MSTVKKEITNKVFLKDEYAENHKAMYFHEQYEFNFLMPYPVALMFKRYIVSEYDINYLDILISSDKFASICLFNVRISICNELQELQNEFCLCFKKS